jgi:hypothetical protein
VRKASIGLVLLNTGDRDKLRLVARICIAVPGVACGCNIGDVFRISATAEEAAEKRLLPASGVKTPHSLRRRLSQRWKRAPPKIIALTQKLADRSVRPTIANFIPFIGLVM